MFSCNEENNNFASSRSDRWGLKLWTWEMLLNFFFKKKWAKFDVCRYIWMAPKGGITVICGSLRKRVNTQSKNHILVLSSNLLQISYYVCEICGRTILLLTINTTFVEFSQGGFQFFQPPSVKVTALAVETEKDAIKEISSPSISNFAT